MTQSLPISEATSTITCGWMTVSAPMVTVSSMYVVAGSRGVAILDDALHAPTLAEHAAVPVRAVDDGGEQRRRRAGRRVMAHEPLDRLRGQERRVTRHHEDRPVEALAVAARLEHRVTGAEPLTLLDDRHAVAGHPADGIGVGTHP